MPVGGGCRPPAAAHPGRGRPRPHSRAHRHSARRRAPGPGRGVCPLGPAPASAPRPCGTAACGTARAPPWRHALPARRLQEAREDVPPRRVGAPLGPRGQEHVGPHVVDTRSERPGTAPRLLRRHGRGSPWHGRRRGPLRAGAVGARLAGRRHEGLPAQRQGARHHPGAEGRQAEDADRGPAGLRDGVPPHPHGWRRARAPCGSSGRTTRRPPAGLEGRTRAPVAPWGPVGGLGHPRGGAEGRSGAARAGQAPDPPGRGRLRLRLSPPGQGLQPPRRRGPLAPAAPASEACPPAGALRSTGMPPRHHAYGPLRPPRLCRRCPGVAGAPPSLVPPVSRGAEEGCSRGCASPGLPAGAATPPAWAAAAASGRRPLRPSPCRWQARPLGLRTVGASWAVACAPAWRRAPSPQMGWARGCRTWLSRPPALRVPGLWLFPWEVALLLHTPACAGHTTERESFPSFGSSISKAV